MWHIIRIWAARVGICPPPVPPTHRHRDSFNNDNNNNFALMSIPLGFVAAEGAVGGGEEGRRQYQRAERGRKGGWRAENENSVMHVNEGQREREREGEGEAEEEGGWRVGWPPCR